MRGLARRFSPAVVEAPNALVKGAPTSCIFKLAVVATLRVGSSPRVYVSLAALASFLTGRLGVAS